MKEKKFIHPTANIDESACIGEESKIWINVQVREDVFIGKGCIISKDVYIDKGVIVGDYCKIQNGISLYNGVTIENNVFLGPHMAFTNDYCPRAFNKEWKVSKTLVKEGASIGANATIVCGNTIGRYAMVGAGSVVITNVEDYELVVGNPARKIGYVCKCGNRLINKDSYESNSEIMMKCEKCNKLYFIKDRIVKEL